VVCSVDSSAFSDVSGFSELIFFHAPILPL
jgi:hypothetical protein